MNISRIYCNKCKHETQHKKYSSSNTTEKIILFVILPLVLANEEIWWKCLQCENKIYE